jgi:hypothetical protein
VLTAVAVTLATPLLRLPYAAALAVTRTLDMTSPVTPKWHFLDQGVVQLPPHPPDCEGASYQLTLRPHTAAASTWARRAAIDSFSFRNASHVPIWTVAPTAPFGAGHGMPAGA